MNKKLKIKIRNFFCILSLITLLSTVNYKAVAQTQPISLSWNGEIGCQEFDQDGDPKEHDVIFLEDISASECFRFCENNSATYTLNNVPSGSSIVWSVVGGNISYIFPGNNKCIVNWGAVGNGNLTVTITNGNTIINKTLCVEKIASPTALFAINNEQTLEGEFAYVCENQLLYFTNLSNVNNGTALVSFYWDFGDGTFSTAENPTHTYYDNDEHQVYLTVTNSCNCQSTYFVIVQAMGEGFNISCPSVVCENQTEIYSLPFNASEICEVNNGWSVSGGTIISQGGGNVAVNWDHVDSSGFGYVTFNPQGCELACISPSTIKVPVIQQNGTISGKQTICLDEQERYSLPQWPTTEIEWSIVGDPNQATATIIQTDQRNEIIITPLVTGTITLRAVYKNTLLNCGGEAEFTINVSNPLIVTGEEIVCVGSSNLYDSNSLDTEWSVYQSNGTLVSSPVLGNDFQYTFNTAGNYYIVAAGQNICETRKYITVIDTPDGPEDIIGVDEICPDVPETFSVLNPQPNSTYIWYITNGTINGSNIGNSISASFDGNAPAELKVYRQTLNPISCISTDFAQKIITITTIEALILNDDPIVCANTTSTYQVNDLSNVLFNDPDVTYEWSLSDPLLGSISAGQGTNQIEVTWNNVQAANCLVEVSIKKCTIEANLNTSVSINPIPTISIDTDNLTICAGEPISFDILSSLTLPTNTQVIWNFTGTPQSGSLENQTYTFFNNTLIPVDYIVTAQIVEPNGCENTTTNIATIQITVKPQPTAVLSLITSYNAFCLPSEIDADIEIASSISGVTITWFHKSPSGIITPLPAPPGNVLHIDENQNGFGQYYFVATNADGCSRESNRINIIENCDTPVFCSAPKAPTVTNNSVYSPCGAIDLIGTISGTHISSSWVIFGPNNAILPGAATSYNVVPGFYQIFHSVNYLCDGQPTTKTEKVDIVVPYEADFGYSASCVNNTSFIVNFSDTSTFFNPVDNRAVNYFYESPSGSNNWLPLAVTGNSLQPGTYNFKVVVTGNYNGSPQDPCEKIISGVVLQPIGNLSIEYDPFPNIPCYDTPVKFKVSGIPNPTYSYLWSFDNSAFVSSNPESVTNTMASPARVFDTPGQHTISVTVTNPSGCDVTLNPITINVPNKCFVGDISATATQVCKYDANNVLNSITLSYDNSSDNCNITSYEWMKGNAFFAATPSITVTDSGLYWLKISNGDCSYECHTRIPVQFINPPSLQIRGNNTYCQGNTVVLTALTQATNIEWYVDGATTPAGGNNLIQSFTNLTVGNHIIKVIVWDANNGCTNTILYPITIIAQPSNVTINIDSFTCTPNDPYFSATLTASVPGVSNAIFNWSNGATGSTITLSEGGPIKVTATIGGCTVSSQIDVPKSPESYMWVFPSGCYDDCIYQSGYIVGPTMAFNHWAWNENQDVINEDYGTFIDPLTLTNDGIYSMTLQNDACEATSAPLSFTTQDCDSCPLEISVDPKIVKGDTPFCSFVVNVSIYSSWPDDFQATVTNNGQILLSPSTITIQPGPHNYSFTIIPMNGFNGGTVQITIQGVLVDFETAEETVCNNTLEIDVPSCESARFSNTKNSDVPDLNSDKNLISLYPNPTQNAVTLTYDLVENNAFVNVYDLSGRLITNKNITTKKGAIHIDTSTYEEGVYIVVIKQNDKIINQQKLIKK